MLNIFRTHLRHTKWILLLIVFSFLFFFGVDWWSEWGGRDRPGGMWIARVNGEYVPIEQWRNIARRMDEQYRQMLGNQYEQFRKNLNIEMAAARQAVQQVLRSHPLVKSYRAGEQGEGGSGVTIAYLAES